MHFKRKKPFPATGDATYRKHVGEGPRHVHRQHAQKFGKNGACGFGDICIVNGEENPFPAIRVAAYRKCIAGGPSHGNRQHAEKFGKDRACGPEISWGTDRQTDPQTDILITILRNRSRGQSNKRFLRAEFNDTDTLNKQTKSRNDTRCVNRWPGKKSCHSCRKLLVLK